MQLRILLMKLMYLVSKVRTGYSIQEGVTKLFAETANMLIMILAYTQVSGNKTFVHSHYGLLRNWALYLGDNSLTPSNQYATYWLLLFSGY